jgi:uncharacterized OB-fold protein
MTDRPLPDLTHPDFAPFWSGCAGNVLIMPECANQHIVWPPRPNCPTCRGQIARWVDVPRRGLLYSWTVIHRTRQPWFESQTPYVLAIGTLDHPQLLRLVARCTVSPDELEPNMPLAIDFQQAAEGVALPFWRAPGDSDKATP